MVEERARATQFFHYYKPCMEQQITLIADIEQLQSILEETTNQCESPYLPPIYEDLINEYKVPDYLSFNVRRGSSANGVCKLQMLLFVDFFVFSLAEILTNCIL